MLQSGSIHQPPTTWKRPSATRSRISLEQLRVALLDPLEEDRRVAREDEVRVLVHAVDRGLERRAHLLVALGPLPQPHRVDVRVADHVRRRIVRLRRQASTCSRITWSRRTCISWTRAVDSDGTRSARRRARPRAPRAAGEQHRRRAPRARRRAAHHVRRAPARREADRRRRPPARSPRTCRSKTSS